MAKSAKIKEAAERAKQKEAAEEWRIEQALQKVEAFAEQHDEEVIADARKRQHESKRKRPGA